MTRSEKSREHFLGGYNCAQSLTLAFVDDFDCNREHAVNMAAGFGGGMGKQQYTCGAVTGAIMVLGLIEGEKPGDNNSLKANAYSRVKEFSRIFMDEFETLECSKIIGCDLNTPEGEAKFKEENIQEAVCAKCVMRAVEIVESIMTQ